MSQMQTTLFFWPTPNCYKISILLEELQIEYKVHPVHIGKGEQFERKFLEISPHGKVPALKEHHADGKTQTIFESGAIMLYLAEKHNQFLDGKKTSRLSVVQWLMFQMGNLGPMLGQAHHFRHYASEPIKYAIDRYTNEAAKIYSVLDEQLGKSQFIAGDDYSIADIAVYPWLRPQKMQGQNISYHPNIQRWYNIMRARPAIKRGLLVMQEQVSKSGKKPVGNAWKTLFDSKPRKPTQKKK